MNTNLLQVYVSESCWGCREARKIAYQMGVEYPDIDIELVVRELTHDWPEKVIATPAYVLNGRLISLGNPSPDDLRGHLSAASGDAPP